MKLAFNFSLVVLIMVNFSNCSSAQKLQKEAPFSLGLVYSQSWVAGIKGGGSGINLFIPLNEDLPNNVKLDSVYFRGKATKLEINPDNPLLYIGRFLTEVNQQKDIIMSSDLKEEYGNQLPIKKVSIPFEIEDNECIISFIVDNKIKYFKFTGVIDKKMEQFPTAPLKPN